MTVELIIAIIVGAILILSLNNIVVSQGFLANQSRDLIVSNAFAEQKIEALRSKGYLGVPIGTSSITTELPSELNKPRTGTLTVTQQSASIKKIRLSISYNEQGTQRTQIYTTLLGELGVGQ